MYVMTIDQRGSTGDVDRVPGLLKELSALSTAGRFERSVGDEVQGVVERADEVVEIALHALRSGRWYVGIGVGEVDLPLPASPREGSGPAFVAARAAVDRAKAAAAHVPLAVVAGRGRRTNAAASAATGRPRRTAQPGPGGDEGLRQCRGGAPADWPPGPGPDRGAVEGGGRAALGAARAARHPRHAKKLRPRNSESRSSR